VMRLYKLLPDGRRQIVGFALPGDFLGLGAGDRHVFSADAVGPVVVCRFSRNSFARFVAHRPNVLRRINEFAASELSQAQEQMVLLGRRSAEEKIATFLVGWRNRLARLGQTNGSVYLGLTIEALSRTLTKLERDGVIEILPWGFRLKNPARAKAIAAA
jgi:CRP/FNR family transcriptional regulator